MALRIFFSGIGGSGVSAIAGFMKSRGHIVSGSDRAFDQNPEHPLLHAFKQMDIPVHPQDGSGITESLNLVVMSTAVEEDRPEVVRAKALGIPIKTRPEYLALLTEKFRTIAVAGTSGKSTTSGMLAFLMNRLGMEPNFIGGGRVKRFRELSSTCNFITGESEILVIEACESDGSLVKYQPENSIILNLALDHHLVNDTAGMFQTLIEKTSGQVFINADDNNLKMVEAEKSVTFSIEKSSNFKPTNIELKPFGSSFFLNGTQFILSIPGRHNIYNALASISLLSEMGVSLDEISKCLTEFDGIDRRFDVCLNDKGRVVIDDYAHSPHKIAAFMKTMADLCDSVCYVFQPHGFAPTRLMKDDYIKVFSEKLRDNDHLALLPIYYAGGTTSRNISSNDLADGIRTHERSVEVLHDRGELFEKLSNWKCYAVMGARDETLASYARQIAERISSSP